MLYFNALSKKEIHGKTLKEVLVYALCKYFKTLNNNCKIKSGKYYINLSSIKLDADDIYLVTTLTGDDDISSLYKSDLFSNDTVITTTTNCILQVAGRYNVEMYEMLNKNKSDEKLLYYIENSWLRGPEIDDTTYDCILSSIKII